MLKKVYCVKDRLNGFMNLFLEDNDEVAKRGFLAGISNQPKGSLFYLHPGDYSLYYMGTFNLESGTLSPASTPQWLVTADETLFYTPALATDSNAVSNLEKDLKVFENESVD